MNGFSYVPERFPRRFAWRSSGIRLALAAIAASLTFVTAGWSFELGRLAKLDDELRVVRLQAREAGTVERRSQRAQTRLQQLRALGDGVMLARREALVASNAVARIGNALPPNTWLTNLQAASAGTWTIAGRTTRVAEVGATLRALQRLDGNAVARLVSVSATGRSGRVLDFVIAWDRAP